MFEVIFPACLVLNGPVLTNYMLRKILFDYIDDEWRRGHKSECVDDTENIKLNCNMADLRSRLFYC